jgi:pimeloyl-ACP methyl ester carboxylesterase
MDIARAAMGQNKFIYLGKSYGTYLGAIYADTFPGTVGRMVLDGAMAPSLTDKELSLGQAQGFETATRSYVADCVKKGGLPAGRQRRRGHEGDPRPAHQLGRQADSDQGRCAGQAAHRGVGVARAGGGDVCPGALAAAHDRAARGRRRATGRTCSSWRIRTPTGRTAATPATSCRSSRR